MAILLASCVTTTPAAAGLKIIAPPFDIVPFVFEQVWHQRTTGDAGLAWLRAAIQRAALDDA
ncbi:hypothetical protein [Janthinobacterium agaricidamnosum]|uniref:Uncharacterized protein n=1 Tax=Janthinobacterium agaricidamnosum NBRC 102515 = DSM 9628 TaxID=1349767 RepID=W0UZS1_9BURK|nr:hypothetical protein [Janthinobacterium agaricidamnosum]CDG81121.1 hypothetical protein GJA_461 [Janthinobacterium agaricidamnosum NBRC 102515 = DSM 9628]